MGGNCFQVRRAFTKSISNKLSGIPAIETVPGTMLRLSNSTGFFLAGIIFLRRFDDMAWPVGGTCAAVISHPTEKQKHSIRIFPINNWLFDLVKHLFKRGYFAESIEK